MKPEIRAWILYDWANSAFATSVVAGLFPIYFKEYLASDLPKTESTALLGWTNSLSTLAVLILAPVLGIWLDRGGPRRVGFSVMVGLGVLSTLAISLLAPGRWFEGALAFGFGLIGFSLSTALTDSLLPEIATEKDRDRVSALGYAFGYLGGGTLFLIHCLMIQYPSSFGLESKATAVQLAFGSTAAWWLFFSLPLIVRLRPKEREQKPCGLRWSTMSNRPALLFLAAFLLVNDGVGTVQRMAVDYGLTLGLDAGDLLLALLLVQFVGFPCAWVAGIVGSRWHPRPVIFFSIIFYCGVIGVASVITTSTHFYGLAILIGIVQGAIQAMFRSYFCRFVPVEESGEWFGLYNATGRFSGLIGPAMMGSLAAAAGSARIGILSVIGLFILGGALLTQVQAPKSSG